MAKNKQDNKETKQKSETKAKKTTKKKPTTKAKAPTKAKSEKPVEKASTEKPNEVLTFNDDTISLTVEKKPNCMVEFTAIANKVLIHEARLSAIKSIRKNASIPGFRKGKAPEQLIAKHYPKEVEQKLRSELANVAFKRSEALANIPVLSKDTRVTFDVLSFSDDEAKLLFSFETEPTIPDVDLSKFSFSDIKQEKIDAKRVHETLKQIQGFYADTKEVSKRAVKEDDVVIVDIEDLDTDPVTKPFADARFEVSKKQMAAWLYDIIIGLKVNDTKEGVSRPNEDDSEEVKKQYESKKVRVTIKKILEKKLPPLDDELAKKVGAKSLEEMKSVVEKQLKKQAELQYKHALRDEVSKQIIETNDFDIPESILVKELQHRRDSLYNNQQFRLGWSQKSKEEQEEFVNNMKKEAANAIRLFYLCRKIIQDKKIAVSLEEPQVDAPTSQLEAMFSVQPPHSSPKDLSEEEKALQYSRKMLEAAQDYLIDQVQKS